MIKLRLTEFEMSTSPALSVLIASRERRALLHRCLDSLAAQTVAPERFEVLVIDDGSTDGTTAMVEALDTPFDLRLARFEQVGKYKAINDTIEKAGGSVCLVLDDDVVASPELIEAHLTAHEEDGMTLGIGCLLQVPVKARDWYAHAFAKGWNEHFKDRDGRPALWSDCYGANFSAPRAALLEIGGFATDLTVAGDLEIGYRLVQAGCRPRYLGTAHGLHDDQKRSAQMLADARRQGPAHIEIAAKHPEMAATMLDWSAGAGPKELRLRRLLIALRVPVKPLVWLGPLVPGEGRRMVWFHFVRRYAFWRAVRTSVDRRRWSKLLSPLPA
jgi:glycosyltransferase involved in cell wall biosynthesis